MKRIATLFLIVTLFYNMIGYYLMFAYQEQQAWVARMEKTSHTDFRVMRLNASLYSFADDTEFEEVNEDVIINNKSYHIFKKQVKDIAKELISLYAKRKNAPGFAFSPDTYLQAELESSFLYEDTPDQDAEFHAGRGSSRRNPYPRSVRQPHH